MGTDANFNASCVRRCGKVEFKAKMSSNARSVHHTCSGQAAAHF